MARLMERYQKEVAGKLASEFKIDNRFAVPRLTKIVVSMGLGKAIAEKRRLEQAVDDLSRITGQKPLICKAKKSVSNFKLRQGMDIGAKVTLRGRRMYEFLDRLISLAIPRVRDFRGLSPNSFDGRGSYNMGLVEQTVFPEVDANKDNFFFQGLNVTMVTSARNDEQARRLLQLMGMPFREK
jgi:large subunit ribosomal protein L5